MSNADTRQEIADAMSSVDGIVGHVARPNSINEGDSWPQWRGLTPVAHATENTWNVVIILPQTDDITADAYADAHAADILEALRTVMYVDSLVPATIDTEAGQLYAILISGRSE